MKLEVNNKLIKEQKVFLSFFLFQTTELLIAKVNIFISLPLSPLWGHPRVNSELSTLFLLHNYLSSILSSFYSPVLLLHISLFLLFFSVFVCLSLFLSLCVSVCLSLLLTHKVKDA